MRPHQLLLLIRPPFRRHFPAPEQVQHGLAAADNGAQFRATVTVAGASAVSASAPLAVRSPVTLNITRSGGQLTVTWSAAGCTLQEAAAICSPTGWGPSAVVNGVPFIPSPNQQYFRLICP